MRSSRWSRSSALVTPDPAGLSDDDALRGPGPSGRCLHGLGEGLGDVGRGQLGPLGARIGEHPDGDVLGTEAADQVPVRAAEEVDVPALARRRPDDLAGGSREPHLLPELLTLEGGEHRPQREPSVLRQRAELGRVRPDARHRLVEVHERPEVAAVVDDARDQDVEGTPLVGVVGVGDLRDPAVLRELLSRRGREPLLGDERPGAVLRAQPERQLHRREGRGAPQHRGVGLVVAGDGDELQHLVGPQDLDLARLEVGAQPDVLGDLPDRVSGVVASPAVAARTAHRRRG